MKTLSHKQEVRVKGFTPYANRITVGTSRGYALANGEEPEAAHLRAVGKGHGTAWTNQECGVLTGDYEGKKAELDAKAKATAEAPEIEHGEVVEIEGEQFTVRVTGERYSDPVHFVRVIA